MFEEIVFSQDTGQRKEWFTGVSFSHPAKMSLGLQIYLIERYTKPGDIILDPMFGSGTLLVACALGRNVIGIELEQKFVDMAKANWDKIKSLGPMLGCTMGQATIIQGDARNLPEVLADKVIMSPPYEEAMGKKHHSPKADKLSGEKSLPQSYTGKADSIICSPPYAEGKAFQDLEFMNKTSNDQKKRTDNGVIKGHGFTVEARQRVFRKAEKGKIDNPSNIGNLKYGEINKVIMSPPHGNRLSDKAQKDNDPQRMSYQQSLEKLGKADSIICSPPYEGSLTGEVDPKQIERIRKGVAEGKITGRESVRVAQKGFNPHTCLAIDRGYAPKADSIICSPPYEASVTGKDGIDWSKGTRGQAEGNKPRDKSKEPAFEHSAIGGAGFRYSGAKENIGNLKSQNYLEAMLQVYQGCYRVLRDGGLMILVTKNFIRNKQIIRLDLDTIALCEQAGFTLKERLKRKLTHQSFWRVIYYKKFPYVIRIEFEDVLIFEKCRK